MSHIDIVHSSFNYSYTSSPVFSVFKGMPRQQNIGRNWQILQHMFFKCALQLCSAKYKAKLGYLVRESSRIILRCSIKRVSKLDFSKCLDRGCSHLINIIFVQEILANMSTVGHANVTER